ncbi:hypothetical protein KAR91_37305 [Candidatus Pacearchaeota archaeon]|nr:hypothetical protein [Candidatus Pacearchaeota archaeon]
MLYKSYNSKHRVTIRRKANGYIEEDISDDVVKITTSKVYGRAYGGFTVETTFAKRIEGKRYDEILENNDVILIELSKNGTKGLRLDMIGLVSRVARTMKQDGSGHPDQRVAIQGQDFGKLLDKNNCGFDVARVDKFLGSNEAYYKERSGYLLSGTPNELVQSAYDVFFTGQLGDWVKSYVIADMIDSPDAWEQVNMVVTGDTGPVWTTMKMAENAPYNTLYTYTGEDGKFHIGLEKTPFNNVTGKLDRETFHEFDGHDIVKENVGKSDSELVNYIYYKTTFGIQGTKNNNLHLTLKGPGVKYDVDSVKVHGYRPYKPSTSFTPYAIVKGNGLNADEGNNPNVRDALTARTLALWNWMRRNHEYESGDFDFHGSPEIRTGDGILHTGTNMEYFVEQVNHSYDVEGPSFITTLGVTRGQDHGRG